MAKKRIVQSLLLRYMVSYVLLMAVLLAGVTLFINRGYANTIRANAVEANINKLSTIRYQHEEMIATLLNMGSQIGLSPYIRPFRLETEPMLAFHLKMQLAPYTLTNDFIDQLYLIFHEDDYLYSSATSVGLSMLVEKLLLYEDTPPAMVRALLRQERKSVTFLPAQNVQSILVDGHPRVVTAFVPISAGSLLSYGNLLCLVKESTYQRLFADEIFEPRNTYIIHQGSVLASLCSIDITDEAILRALDDMRDGAVLDLRIHGTDYLLIAQQNHRYDMAYVTLVPTASQQVNLLRERITFALFLLALSIPCVLLIYYFSRRHTLPIKELRRLANPETTSRDDFAAIHSGIEALNLRNQDLNTRLTQSIPVRRANLVKSFVKGRFLTREDALEAAVQLDMHIDRPYYVIALVGFSAQDAQEPDTTPLLDSLDAEVTGWCMELVAMEQHLFALFADSEDALHAWVWALHEREAYADATISLSNVHDDFMQAGNAYLEASTAYDNRFVMGRARILRFSDIGTAAVDIVPFTRTYLEGFRKALHSGDADSLTTRIDELFHYLGNTELSLFAFRMIYHNIIATMLGERIDQPGTGNRLDALQYYDVFTLSNCHSISDLDDILRKLCNDILLQRAPEERKVPSIIGDIVAYMRQNYADPMLSMSAIADHYGISAARLSLDFKEQIGMNPSDYLLLLRMEEAKAMLAGTEMSVKSIGLALGYYDASGFIRRFKHYAAMTPAQYRQSVKEKEDGGSK